MQLELPSTGYGSPSSPTRRRIELFADWIEAQAFVWGDALAQPELVERLEGAEIVTDSDDAWQLVGDAFTTCRRRLKQLGPAYPFGIVGKHIEFQGDKNSAYLFCLLASLPEQFRPLRKSYPSQFRDVFESLVAAALRTLMPGWTVYETGWSKNAGLGKGKIVALVAEWSRSKSLDETVFPSANDAQVDVALVRDFTDGRNAIPVLLGQCASGVTDWKDKTVRPNINRWRKAVQFSTQPLALFAVPFALDDTSFKETSDESDGLVLDRMRICEGLTSLPDTVLVCAIETWMKSAIPLLPEAA